MAGRIQFHDGGISFGGIKTETNSRPVTSISSDWSDRKHGTSIGGGILKKLSMSVPIDLRASHLLRHLVEAGPISCFLLIKSSLC
jgi:hypothetical protein